MFEKILVCLDGSALAENILPHATEIARRFNSRVYLLHVVPEPVAAAPGIPGVSGGPIETPRMLEQMREEERSTQAYLETLAGPMREQGLEVETVLLQGSANDAIVSYAEDNDIGLIAMVSHGHSGLGHALMGSVADHVLKKAGRPVLMVKLAKRH